MADWKYYDIEISASADVSSVSPASSPPEPTIDDAWNKVRNKSSAAITTGFTHHLGSVNYAHVTTDFGPTDMTAFQLNRVYAIFDVRDVKEEDFSKITKAYIHLYATGSALSDLMIVSSSFTNVENSSNPSYTFQSTDWNNFITNADSGSDFPLLDKKIDVSDTSEWNVNSYNRIELNEEAKNEIASQDYFGIVIMNYDNDYLNVSGEGQPNTDSSMTGLAYAESGKPFLLEITASGQPVSTGKIVIKDGYTFNVKQTVSNLRKRDQKIIGGVREANKPNNPN